MLIALWDFLQWIWGEGVVNFFTATFAYFVEVCVLIYFKLANTVMPFAWGVASQILDDLNLSSYMLTAWEFIPLESRQILAYFRIPEVINNIMTFGIVKIVLKFIPFF